MPPPAPQRRIEGQECADEDLDCLCHGDDTPLPSLPHSPLDITEPEKVGIKLE